MAQQNDLVGRYCKGQDEQFGGVACQHYNPSENVCRVLKSGCLRLVFETGQCHPLEYVKSLVRKHLLQYTQAYEYGESPQKWNQDLESHAQSIAFLLTEQFLIPKDDWHTNFTLPALTKYLQYTIPRRVQDILQEEQELPEMLCRSCEFLSKHKPHRCESKLSPEYDQTRRPSDKACERGFEALGCVRLDEPDMLSNQERFKWHLERKKKTQDEIDILPATPDELLSFGLLLEDWSKLLLERYLQATGGQRTIYRDHYLIFIRMAQLRFEGVEHTEALRRIADEIGKSMKQVRYRYLPDIMAFLRKKDVL